MPEMTGGGGFAAGLTQGVDAGARLNANVLTSQTNMVNQMLSIRGQQISLRSQDAEVTAKLQANAVKEIEEYNKVFTDGIVGGDPENVKKIFGTISGMTTRPKLPDGSEGPSLADALDHRAGRPIGTTQDKWQTLMSATPTAAMAATNAGEKTGAETKARINTEYELRAKSAATKGAADYAGKSNELAAGWDNLTKRFPDATPEQKAKFLGIDTVAHAQGFYNPTDASVPPTMVDLNAHDAGQQIEGLKSKGFIPFNVSLQPSTPNGLTTTQSGALKGKMMDLQTAGENLIRQSVSTIDLINKGGEASMGFAGTIAGGLNSIRGMIDGIQQIATEGARLSGAPPPNLQTLTDRNGQPIKVNGKAIDAITPQFLEKYADTILKNVQGAAGIRGLIKSNMIIMAYQAAAVRAGQENRSLSDADFRVNLEALAAGVTAGGQQDPKIATKVMGNFMLQTVKDFEAFWVNHAPLVNDATFDRNTPDLIGKAAVALNRPRDEIQALFEGPKEQTAAAQSSRGAAPAPSAADVPPPDFFDGLKFNGKGMRGFPVDGEPGAFWVQDQATHTVTKMLAVQPRAPTAKAKK